MPVSMITCPTPGMRIRSGGRGRGLARGRGQGPLGVPFGQPPRPLGRRYIGMGQISEPTMVDQIRTIYQAVVQLDPLISFASNHPYLLITFAMVAMGTASWAGAFIGKGLREELEARGRR